MNSDSQAHKTLNHGPHSQIDFTSICELHVSYSLNPVTLFFSQVTSLRPDTCVRSHQQSSHIACQSNQSARHIVSQVATRFELSPNFDTSTGNYQCRRSGKQSDSGLLKRRALLNQRDGRYRPFLASRTLLFC